MFVDVRGKISGQGGWHSPFKSCVVPRPIAWISSISPEGVTNIGPYSYFNAISDIPPIIMFATSFKSADLEVAYHDVELQKDSIRNAEAVGDFVVNIVNYDNRYAMSDTATSLEYNESEADKFNIPMIASSIVKSPRIASSPVSLECVYLKTVEVEGVDFQKTNQFSSNDLLKASSKIVLGQVVGIHIDEKVLTNGKIDVTKLKPLARLGYNQYTVVDEAFVMEKKW